MLFCVYKVEVRSEVNYRKGDEDMKWEEKTIKEEKDIGFVHIYNLQQVETHRK